MRTITNILFLFKYSKSNSFYYLHPINPPPYGGGLIKFYTQTMANFFTKIITSLFSNDSKSETKSEIHLENKNDKLLDFEINEEDREKYGWDEVFYATFSDDINKMLMVVDIKTIPINRHYLLQTIVNNI